MNKNQNSKTDLITLTHPLMLLSIFVLLINDHILKVHFPSALTGKISDFAGLFFFPILLSAILHFVIKPFQFESRNIVFTSFLFTAVWFTLIKTVPFFNNFTENLFSIKIILDPSDLIALVMLPLAWRLREKIASESKIGFSRLSLVVLAIASFATMATSPAYNPVIYNLIVHENIVYAEFSEGNFMLYSENGGKIWEEIDFELPTEVINESGKRPELPFTLCLPENMNICYQTGEEVILESEDGGKTWDISWDFPIGRKEFFYRLNQWSDLGPYDLEYINFNGNQMVIAAMGSQGVLVKTNNGEWESFYVGYTGQILFETNSFQVASSIVDKEFYFLITFALFFLSINIIVNAVNKNSLDYKKARTYPLIAIFTFFFLVYLNILFAVGLIISFAFLILTIISTIDQLINNANKQAKNNVIPIILITVISYSLFILWAYGIIPVYETALWIAIGLYILLLLWILYLPTKEFIQAKMSRSKRDLPE